jgi:transmembrane sensor
MSVEETSTRNELSPAVITDAAAWVARLHGPLRTPTVERGVRTWLAEHPDHGRALELVTESWEEVATLKSAANIEVSLPSDNRKPERKRLPLALAAALLVMVVAGAIYHFQSAVVSTGIGEQRVLVLEDGTRISLNTSTRILVDYDVKRRHLRLESGEALFDVAKDSTRPFVVSAGDREVTALGTAFLVRRDPQRTVVTLMEGTVVVTLDAVSDSPVTRATSTAAILAPGERATFVANQGSPRLDHPALDTLTSWQRGKVSLENLSLAEAVAEMNRYSTVPLVIERPEAEQLRVSGIFRAGDSLSFAAAVSENYGLEVQRQPRRILLSGPPHPQP